MTNPVLLPPPARLDQELRAAVATGNKLSAGSAAVDEASLLQQACRVDLMAQKATMAFQVSRLELGRVLLLAKLKIPHDSFLTSLEASGVSASTSDRARRFYQLCFRYPGSVAIRGTWGRCRTKTGTDLLLSVLDEAAGRGELPAIWGALRDPYQDYQATGLVADNDE